MFVTMEGYANKADFEQGLRNYYGNTPTPLLSFTPALYSDPIGFTPALYSDPIGSYSDPIGSYSDPIGSPCNSTNSRYALSVFDISVSWLPTSLILPSSRKTMRSALRIVDSR